MKDRPASSLIAYLGKTLNEIASTFEWFNCRSLRCLLVEILWQINKYLKLATLQSSIIIKWVLATRFWHGKARESRFSFEWENECLNQDVSNMKL